MSAFFFIDCWHPSAPGIMTSAWKHAIATGPQCQHYPSRLLSYAFTFDVPIIACIQSVVRTSNTLYSRSFE